MLNCKPGDLAIIKKVGAPDVECYLGRIVQCISSEHWEGEWAWHTEPALYDDEGALIVWTDSHLMPIRDPGEDAQDETLSWLDVPSKEHA